jgi:hypothetical protein
LTINWSVNSIREATPYFEEWMKMFAPVGPEEVHVGQVVGTDQSVVVEQMEWFARDVMPVFKKSSALRADMDGARIPDEVGDGTGLPKVLAAVRAAGYDEPARRKLADENLLKVLAAVWTKAILLNDRTFRGAVSYVRERQVFAPTTNSGSGFSWR